MDGLDRSATKIDVARLLEIRQRDATLEHANRSERRVRWRLDRDLCFELWIPAVRQLHGPDVQPVGALLDDNRIFLQVSANRRVTYDLDAEIGSISAGDSEIGNRCFQPDWNTGAPRKCAVGAIFSVSWGFWVSGGFSGARGCHGEGQDG